jgi:alpha-L-fucosidase
MDLYKKAGAKYFVSMGVHHDNFDLWNSKHTRWNAVNMGPKKDIVGLFRRAALKRALKFGVSEHLWISYKWFGTSHDSDKSGEYAGVPYEWQLPEELRPVPRPAERLPGKVHLGCGRHPRLVEAPLV